VGDFVCEKGRASACFRNWKISLPIHSDW